MAKVFTNKLLVAIDIGTTKICVLVANQLDDHNLEVLGIGKSPSHGLAKGVVVDIAKTINSISTAVKEAELMSGHTIESASIGIAGAHISSKNSSGAVPLKSGQVKSQDVVNVLEAAKAIPLADGQKILHVLPRYFVIDGGDKIQDPIGMHGVRLEVQAHIITGSVASVQNLITCTERAGVKIEDVVLEQLASARSVLSHDERELGVGVLDIGGGTSDLAIYKNGNIAHTMVLPVAGKHFTNDIAVGLRATLQDAEKIKQSYGCCYKSLLQEDEKIEVELVQGQEVRMINKSELAAIVQPRAEELLQLIKQEIVLHNLQALMRSGLVITGGGSLLGGMKELAESIFKMPVRIGSPRMQFGISEALESPIYATSYGLLLHILKNRKGTLKDVSGPFVKQIFSRMKSWIGDFF